MLMALPCGVPYNDTRGLGNMFKSVGFKNIGTVDFFCDNPSFPDMRVEQTYVEALQATNADEVVSVVEGLLKA